MAILGEKPYSGYRGFFLEKGFELGGFLEVSERALECRAVLWKEPWYSGIMWGKSPTVNWRLERGLGQTGHKVLCKGT